MQIFVSSTESREDDCQASTLDMVFSDNANESVLSYASIPMGEIRPASSLMGMFEGLPYYGDWRIEISQSHPVFPDEYKAALLDWEIELNTKPCIPRAEWVKLSPTALGSSFTPRHLHTAIAIDNSIFVSGGWDGQKLDDLWRYDRDANTFTELNSSGVEEHLPLSAQAWFLSSNGLMTYGGIDEGGPRNQVLRFDLFRNEWNLVPIEHDNALKFE